MIDHELKEIPLAELHASPLQPRFFTAKSIKESFKAGIQANGGTFPKNKAVTVRPRPEGGFEILEGHHRVEAAREYRLDTAWAFIRVLGDREAAVFLAASNSQRSLSPVEHGRHAVRLQELGVSIAEYAASIGKSAETVYGYIRAWQVLEATGGEASPYVNMGHGTLAALAGLEDDRLRQSALYQLQHRGVNDTVGKAVVANLKAGQPLWRAFELAEAREDSPAPERDVRLPVYQPQASTLAAPRPLPASPAREPEPIYLTQAEPVDYGPTNGAERTMGVLVGATIDRNREALAFAVKARQIFQARAEVLEEMFGDLITDRSSFANRVFVRREKLAELDQAEADLDWAEDAFHRGERALWPAERLTEARRKVTEARARLAKLKGETDDGQY